MYQTARQVEIPVHGAADNTEQQHATLRTHQTSAALTAQGQRPKATEQQTGTALSSGLNEKRYKSASQRISISTSQHSYQVHGNY